MIVIIASIIVISAVIVGVLTYNGVFSDKDNDGIPDKVEQAVADVKEDIKERFIKELRPKHKKPTFKKKNKKKVEKKSAKKKVAKKKK